MRFSSKIYLEEENITIPPDSRPSILSLIKEAIKNSGEGSAKFYDKYYARNTYKPFTFSSYIPIKKTDKGSTLDGQYITLTFSTNDYEFLLRVYNGLNNQDIKKKIKLFGKTIKSISGFYLYPEKKINKDKITFKTLSPILVREAKQNGKFLLPDNTCIKANRKEYKTWEKISERDFIEAFCHNLAAQAKRELGIDIEEKDIKIENLNTKTIPVVHGSGNPDHQYKQVYPGIKGIITIQAPPKLLQLFYDNGIGAKKSQGFGMLEVVE
ncbi:CRISPR-associated endoribonuclease Cas6 [Spirochaetia bacterium 38H-sp]|uniref:CRISPR-associated endoribonuclease Cas6 n=1 Tax=Rarispira pelagica TaxID=3141764 RepID=A0ABU9UBD5_9SPIR